uniref:Urease accessory protein UreH-like transmembrane domain-containing protein n=1 Tax=Guillardia theta TaxID=55529 RepID=A0A6U5Y7S2_GUITH
MEEIPFHKNFLLSEKVSESQLDKMGIGGLIGLGASLGVLHVLTGPDHMSAIVTLSVGGRFRAVWMGAQWGLGHSAGLLIMYAVFRAVGGSIDLDKTGHFVDTLVGFVMIALGLYGCYQANKMRKNMRQRSDGQSFFSSSDELLEKEVRRDEEDEGLASWQSESREDSCKVEVREDERQGNHHSRDPAKSPRDVEMSSEVVTGSSVEMKPEITREQAKHDVERIDNEDTKRCSDETSLESTRQRSFGEFLLHTWRLHSRRIVALFVGILHGLAGPGGILGVLPAIALKDSLRSGCYLGSFCVCSILIMGVFAAFWGEITARASSTENAKFAMVLFSSALALCVGIMWLILLFTGTMDQVFP